MWQCSPLTACFYYIHNCFHKISFMMFTLVLSDENRLLIMREIPHLCRQEMMSHRIIYIVSEDNMKSEKLYENAGNLTSKGLDNIIYDEYCFIDEDTDEYTEEYLKNEYNFKSFSAGLTECINKYGFKGNINSAEEKTEYIISKCRENNIQLNPAIIKTWFKDKRPVSEKRSRENVYKLCFALKLDLKQTSDFFYNTYFECPFNFRIHNEAIYFYCLNRGLDYSKAQELIEKADEIITSNISDNNESEYEFTYHIGNEIFQINSEEKLLEYIKKHSNEFLISNKTAYNHAKRLIDECTELAVKLYNDDITYRDERKCTNKKRNIDLLLFVMFDTDMLIKNNKNNSFSKTSQFPELIKSNFPLKMQLSNICNNKKVSYDTMRKALIMMNFFCFFASACIKDEEGDFLQFVAETDDLLESCGYPKLYVRNPYDWLIMHCANHYTPLVELADSIKRYYIYANE